MISVQCELSRTETENTKTVTTVWIPEKFAVKHKLIVINSVPWQISKVYGRRDYKEVNERSQDYKHQRKASDI